MNNIKKWGLALFMLVWGGLTFIFLAGEDDPTNPLPLLEFFAIKLASVGSFYLWARVLKYITNRNLMPSILVPDDPEEEEEDCYE